MDIVFGRKLSDVSRELAPVINISVSITNLLATYYHR